ncbi:kelch repeat-containing protein [Brevibacillus parabrevis]|uniref:kelch repeat-containing protein n=1 Tax=Brevibacillus parabrevis TaxID=54914 RepID=UPI002E226278|nr:kelch repeat-containing protein [Brevibacillus parabrevis]
MAATPVTIPILPEADRLTEGTSYMLYAVDQAGNVSLASPSIFTVDRLAPSLGEAEQEGEAGWRNGTPMNDDRFGGASAVLADGDVVVIGGGMVATGERYDVKNDEWSRLGRRWSTKRLFKLCGNLRS